MPYLSPPTLTRSEVESLLVVTRSHPRDHIIIALALGTGLRLGEIVGLNAGDVYLPDALLPKLKRFRRHKTNHRESLEPDAPLFCNQGRRRISKRRVQVAFRGWQVAAGFHRLYGFHALRHTAVTGIYRASRDLFLAQRFARHASPLTTIAYTHPGDEELRAQVRRMVL